MKKASTTVPIYDQHNIRNQYQTETIYPTSIPEFNIE